MNNQPTIRQLAVEISDELDTLLDLAEKDATHPFHQFDWRMKSPIMDIFMGVLARHAGQEIVNDKDIPARPLPPRRSRSTDEGHLDQPSHD